MKKKKYEISLLLLELEIQSKYIGIIFAYKLIADYNTAESMIIFGAFSAIALKAMFLYMKNIF